jgi:transposase
MGVHLTIAHAFASFTAVEQAFGANAAHDALLALMAEHRRMLNIFSRAFDETHQALKLARHQIFGRSSEKSSSGPDKAPTLTEAADVLSTFVGFLGGADTELPTRAEMASAPSESVPPPTTSPKIDQAAPPCAALFCQPILCQPMIECGSSGGFHTTIVQLDGPEASPAREGDPKKRSTWRGLWFHAHKPEIIEPPKMHEACPSCGGATRCIGESVTEMLRWIPGRLARRQIVRRKSVCAGACLTFTISPWPANIAAPLNERSLPDASLVAKILVDHARFALPVYRQREMMREGDICIPYNSMLRWRALGSELCIPVHEAMHRAAQIVGFGQIDDTRLMALTASENPRGKHTLAGHMWVFTDNATIVYCDYATDWKPSILEEIIGDFTGFLLGDGYAGYARFAEEHQLAGLAGCNEHARRKFNDAALVSDALAQEIVDEFGRIYAVERKAKRDKCTGDDLVGLRQREAKPVFERLRKRLTELSIEPVINGALRRAVTYFLRQYDRLTLYLSQATVPIGNNDLERLIRKIALMRKGSLFVGSAESGRMIAVNLSIVLTCELLKICPYEYLLDVLPKLAGTEFPARRIDELMPHQWARLRGLIPDPQTGAVA